MRTFAIGDIHGGLKALEQLIDRLSLEKNDKLIFLGDYVDGWSESAQVISFLMNLSKSHNCVFIKGNHDVWCEEWLQQGLEPMSWLLHGGTETIESYADISIEERKAHLQFFESMLLYHVDQENRVFLHAGFTSEKGVQHEFPPTQILRDRTLWYEAVENHLNEPQVSVYLSKRFQLYREIYIGHTPTTRYNFYRPIQALNVWNIDTGTAFMGKLSAVNVDTKEVFQSEPVYTLYPNEVGRNK